MKNHVKQGYVTWCQLIRWTNMIYILWVCSSNEMQQLFQICSRESAFNMECSERDFHKICPGCPLASGSKLKVFPLSQGHILQQNHFSCANPFLSYWHNHYRQHYQTNIQISDPTFICCFFYSCSQNRSTYLLKGPVLCTIHFAGERDNVRLECRS